MKTPPTSRRGRRLISTSRCGAARNKLAANGVYNSLMVSCRLSVMGTATVGTAMIIAALLLSTPALAAAKEDACSAASSISDVRFTVALRDHNPVFQPGEIIPLVLSFTSKTKNRYWADVRNYDRSGRLGIEYYCVEGGAPDPLESYFKFDIFMGGGLGNEHALDADQFKAEAELNEWRTLGPGHYQVFVVSHRVWRPPDPGEQTPYARVSEVVRSNAIEIDVSPPDPTWQGEQLRSAVQALAGATSPEDARRAARRLRFLNTRDSTRQLARLWGLNPELSNSIGWDLMFGLYGSPYRQLAIDSMRSELATPDHAITSEFLGTLVNLQVSSDHAWDPPDHPPDFDPAMPDEARTFWERRRAHIQDLMKAEIQTVVANLPRRTTRVRALTLNGLLTVGAGDPAVDRTIRPALIAAWADLPAETQRQLIQYRWPLIAGPDMLPILRGLVAESPPPFSTDAAMMRDAALKHLFELDPAAGREAILGDLKNEKAQPGLEVIRLLAREDVVLTLPPALERIKSNSARGLDYELVDRYADPAFLGLVRAAFEEHAGKWACLPQSAMLRYFLRVAPDYGASQVSAALNARTMTGCYRALLQDLGAELPKVEKIAIGALDDSDPDLVQDAVRALSRWGSADAENALWTRLERFHKEWAGHADQLRITPDYRGPGSRGAALEQTLVFGIAKGLNWICPPEKLVRLARLVFSRSQTDQIESWTKQWKQGAALISPNWFPEDNPTFSLLQYDALTESQLHAKVAQLFQGTELRWQFWQPGQMSSPVSMAKQEKAYERLRAIAEEHGIALEKANHP
jgi:hypothetical protein